MELSVVVPTLNGREQLSRTLDSLDAHAGEAEIIVANGPSADGTTGMVRSHPVVDVLVELSDRKINTARNAGIDHASGDVIAMVNQGLTVDESWTDALRSGLDGAAVVTGPSRKRLRVGMTADTVESRSIAGREVTYFNGGNVAFDRAVLDDADGFDEYLRIGGSRDLAHRLASIEVDVAWRPDMGVSREVEADGGVRDTDWGWKYRSLAYRLVKNYGPRPTVLRRLCSHVSGDSVSTFRGLLAGEVAPSETANTAKRVTANVAIGVKDGLWARRIDRTPRRNPRGRSTQVTRAVELYDWR